MIKIVLLDFDNTLVHTQELFVAGDTAFTQFVAKKRGCGTDQREVLTRLHDLQIKMVDHMGYALETLPLSYTEVLRDYLPDATQEDINHVHAIGMSVHAAEARLKDGVEAAVRKLAAHYDVCIATMGDPRVQHPRIDALPFKSVFRHIEVMEHKDAAHFTALAKKLGAEPHEILMVGDSLRSDIISAIEAGMHAVHIPAPNWAIRETHGYALPVSERCKQYANLGELAEDLIEMKTGARPLISARRDRQP